MAKLRVLCLHGYAQAGPALRAKSGALRSESKKLCEWVFAEAPHVIRDEELLRWKEKTGLDISSESDPCEEAPRTWWRFGPDGIDQESLETTVEHLKELCAAEGPFDGVLGFSQGACLVTVLASRQAHGDLPKDMFKFVALFSGFLPKDRAFAEEILAAGCVQIPSFHCYGATDPIITPAQSLEAVSLFDSPVVLEHEGGHLLPSTKEVRKGFKEWLQIQQS